MSDVAQQEEPTPTPTPGLAQVGSAPISPETLTRLLAARAGSNEALGELLETCRNYLLLVANSALGESLQAKVGASDLVQESFLEAQRIFDRFTGESEQELLAWLVAILENKLGNTIKRYQWSAMRDVSRELPLGGGDASGVAELPLPTSSETPSKVLMQQQAQQQVKAAMAALGDDYRKAVELRVWQDLPLEEVGRQLNRSSEAARKLVARAIDQLRTGLVGDDDDSQPQP